MRASELDVLLAATAPHKSRPPRVVSEEAAVVPSSSSGDVEETAAQELAVALLRETVGETQNLVPLAPPHFSENDNNDDRTPDAASAVCEKLEEIFYRTMLMGSEKLEPSSSTALPATETPKCQIAVNNESGSNPSGAKRRPFAGTSPLKLGATGAFLLLLIFLLFFLILLPKIVENLMYKAQLQLLSVNLQDLSEKGFTVALLGNLHKSSSASVEVNFPQPLDVLFPKPPSSISEFTSFSEWLDAKQIVKKADSLSRLGKAILRPFTHQGKDASVALKTRLMVDDQESFDEFLQTLLSNGQATWVLRGLADVTVGNFFRFRKVKFLKGVPIIGLPFLPLNSSKGTGVMVNSIQIQHDAGEQLQKPVPKGTIPFKVKAVLRNDGPLSMPDLGPLDFQLQFKDSAVGVTTIPVFPLNSTKEAPMEMIGLLYPKRDGATAALLGAFIKGESVTFELVGPESERWKDGVPALDLEEERPLTSPTLLSNALQLLSFKTKFYNDRGAEAPPESLGIETSIISTPFLNSVTLQKLNLLPLNEVVESELGGFASELTARLNSTRRLTIADANGGRNVFKNVLNIVTAVTDSVLQGVIEGNKDNFVTPESLLPTSPAASYDESHSTTDMAPTRAMSVPNVTLKALNSDDRLALTRVMFERLLFQGQLDIDLWHPLSSIEFKSLRVNGDLECELDSRWQKLGALVATLNGVTPIEDTDNNEDDKKKDIEEKFMHGALEGSNFNVSFDIAAAASFTDPTLTAELFAEFVTNKRVPIRVVRGSFVTELETENEVDLQIEDKNFSYVLPMPAFDGFRDIRLSDFQVGQSPNGGLAANISLSFFSASPVYVALGPIFLAWSYKGIQFGPVVARNLTLQPGENRWLLTAGIKTSVIFQKGLALLSEFLGSNELTICMIGRGPESAEENAIYESERTLWTDIVQVLLERAVEPCVTIPNLFHSMMNRLGLGGLVSRQTAATKPIDGGGEEDDEEFNRKLEQLNLTSATNSNGIIPPDLDNFLSLMQYQTTEDDFNNVALFPDYQ